MADSLNEEACGFEAGQRLRGLISQVQLHPGEVAPDGRVVELFGEMAVILGLSVPQNDKA